MTGENGVDEKQVIPPPDLQGQKTVDSPVDDDDEEDYKDRQDEEDEEDNPALHGAVDGVY